MASADLPFGIDVSRYQGVIDWDVIAAHEPKVEFVGIRAAISWGYKDTYLDFNWAEARRVGIPRTAYHVFYPTEDPVRQMAHFINCLDGDLGEMPLSIDVELEHDATPEEFQQNLYAALKYIQEVTQRKPIIYSRANFMNYIVTGGLDETPPEWYADYDYWLAQYLLSGEEHPGPPRMPNGVPRSRCIIHQTSGSGEPFGVQSGALDYNRWQFEQAHLEHYTGLSIPQPEYPDSINQSTSGANNSLWDRLRNLLGSND